MKECLQTHTLRLQAGEGRKVVSKSSKENFSSFFPLEQHYKSNSPGQLALLLGLVLQKATCMFMLLFSFGTFSCSIIQKKQQS